MYSPINCYRHSHKIRTVRDVLNIPSISLGELKKRHGKDWIIAYIAAWLVDLNDNAQVKNKMSGAGIDFTAERIYETYPLKVTDLTLFFRNVKEGVYGQYYENLSGEKIMEWLRQYFDLRCEYAQMHSQSGHTAFNVNTDKMAPEVIKKMFQGVGDTDVDHSRKGGGIGSRTKNVLNADISESISLRTSEYLIWYLVLNAKGTENHMEDVYNSVKAEIDKRIGSDNAQTMGKRMQWYIDIMVRDFDRQILEDTITDWSNDPIRKPYIGMLKAKRKTV